MTNDNCRDNLFLSCPRQILDNQAPCGCLMSDFLPLVEECKIDIIVVLHILGQKLENKTGNLHFVDLLKKYWRKFVISISLKFDTKKRWKKWIFAKTLALIEWWYCHHKFIVAILAILLLMAIISLNTLLLALIAFVALLVYIPLMQVKKNIERYYIIESSHFRKQYVNENGSHFGSSQSEIRDTAKCFILRSLLENKFPRAECDNLRSSERKVIDQLVGQLSGMDCNVEVVTVLLNNGQKTEYEIFE